MQRRLAAILAIDVVGFSRLMARDEDATVAALGRNLRSVFKPAVKANGGRIVKLLGDGALVEFPSITNATECALALQSTPPETVPGLDAPLTFRIGLNIGDIIQQGEDIFGDGVNIAARLEALAPEGGIALSASAHAHLAPHLAERFDDIGPQTLKNFPAPVTVLTWTPEHRSPRPTQDPEKFKKASIVVLAFDNMSGDPDQEFFSDGISEDIITELSHFREFFVIARNTSFTYKGTPVRAEDVCAELGVRYLLEGSVRKAGNRIRVTAQLIEGATGAHLWAGRFDRDLDDIFAVQDEITQAIVASVAPEALNAETHRSRRKAETETNAWEKILLGRWYIGHLSEESIARAQAFATDAIALDPRLSDAHAILALAKMHAMLHLWRRDTKVAIAEAIRHGQDAVKADESDATAHSILGMAYMFGRDYDKAPLHLNRALQLNPNLSNAHGVLAAFHGVSREYAAARASAERATTLSPRDPYRAFWYGGHGIAAYLDENYERCIEVCNEVLAEFPNYASALRQLAAAQAMIGQSEAAQATMQRLLALMPGLTVSMVRDIVPIRYPDDHERWLEGLRRAGMPE
ncbi:adenylate/guanylate cyclase domain-containing protein [Shimia aestuarii]|uniref:Adenylate and Guanylate cyclase catalytic domain-containing protein n=1 Tax=Shimia aestuarii TaxID=254406 RepID=A0A1I4IAP0_9RHOB|nr:adenylate/guanylate cyclase domain-containing protein [Shimia aestuarii]SFL51452.1 Adenylate and Guanylate cyclase catalytic domain-containing protein [Shimia aestuarii]